MGGRLQQKVQGKGHESVKMCGSELAKVEGAIVNGIIANNFLSGFFGCSRSGDALSELWRNDVT